MDNKPTEWDINGGDFNKPIEFAETIKDDGVDFIVKKLEEAEDNPVDTLQTIPPVIMKGKPPKSKSKRINPDSIRVLGFAVTLVSILMLSSFTVSFTGIYEVSAWTGIPTILQWLPALFIDAAILAYTISLVVFKARGESTWRTLAGLTGFAAMSVVANVAHTVSFWNGSLSDYRAWIGTAITALAPIAVLLASEEITRLAFAQPDGE